MRFVKERVKIICEQLEKLGIVRTEPLMNIQVKEGCFVTPSEADHAPGEWRSFDTLRDRWYGPDRHYWFRTELRVPESFDKKALWLRIHTGLDEWNDGLNPQFLLFANGEVIQGLDINHREVLLRQEAKAGDIIRLDLQSYTGTLHNEFALLANLEEQDEKIKTMFYDLSVPLDGLKRMPEDSQTRLQTETALTETINLLDFRKPYSREFYESLEKAEEYLHRELYEKLGGYDDIMATCIGHTHIDVAWLWTIDQVRQKASRSFATVLKLMDEYPDYHFMSSQPKLYSLVKERHPEMYEKIRQRVKEGRWEPEGGMWVEADCNLTSGESLVRQFLFGKRFFREEFGVDNRILWLPDVFGYSAAMPQIMKKCGISYFMTTKLAWNEFNKIPNDTMEWEGIDGSRILTHMITTLGVDQPESSFFTTYNGMLQPDSIMGGWNRYQNKEINNDILVCYGYGDGGGGPTRAMLENSKRMEKGIKGVPKVRQAFSGTYFDELWEKIKDNKRLPEWVGELYFEFHRGTYTSMARNKRSNRKSEFAMMELEFLSVLAEQCGMEYPRQEIDRLWEMILTNQFHDILPGSSIREVYEVTKKEYEEIEACTGNLMAERLKRLGSSDEDAITVWNTLGHERNDIVVLPDTDAKGLTDGTHVYPVQKTADGAIAYLFGTPSKGYQVLRPCEAPSAAPVFAITDRADGGYLVDTPFYQAEINGCGQFTMLYDKENERQVLKEHQVGNEFRIYEDKPLQYSNWNIDIFHLEKSKPVDQVRSMEWIEYGPVRATLLVELGMMDTVIRQKIHFYANDRRIDFETYVDWKFAEQLLKVHFPVDIHTDEATYDIQFGNVTRKIHTNTSWDEAKFEVCGHKWADLSEGEYGVSLMNDCKYGYSMRHQVMTLTLIKSGTHPNKTADQEEHFFTYSLYPHNGTWRQSHTVQEAMNLNVPQKAVKGAAPSNSYSFMKTDRPNVVLETIKKAEDGDGIIVRMYEVQNSRSRVNLKVSGRILDAEETDLLENPTESHLEVGEQEIGFTIKPYEIRTIRIRFA
ncbi:MAG: alpha-mannosidase [Fusicatenibacter sp.]